MSFFEETRVPPRPATVRDVESQIGRLRSQLQDQLKKAQQEAVQQANQRAAAIQQEQIRKIQNSISALDEASRRNLETMDRRHREQLQNLTKRVYDDMEKSQQQIVSRINQQIENLASSVSERIQEMEQTINDHFKRNEREIESIHDSLADIRQRFQNEDELAHQVVDAAKKLLNMVENRTLLDRFAPGYEAQDVRARIKDLLDSPLRGAALTAKAEETITQIWQTERHAIQEKAKHDAMVEIALTQVEKVLTIVNKNREIEREVEGGDPMKVECNFWSEGEFERLEKELDELKAELEDRYNRKLTKERIEEILKRCTEIEGRILQISAEAVAKAILSETRVETVEDIVNAMEAKGWTLKNSKDHPEFDYMGGEVDHDWRKGVCAVLENNVGEEITIIVDPVSDSQNRLIVHQETSKSGRTDKEVHERMQTIEDELHNLGYEVGTPMSGETYIPEMGSTERLGRAHATDKVRQKLVKP